MKAGCRDSDRVDRNGWRGTSIARSPDMILQAGSFGSLATARIARQPHSVLQAKYAEMDDRALKAP
jgi:hypothetical protein